VLSELVVDEQGRVLQYRLVNSSGSLLFDQSALDALAKVAEVRPPPPGMDHTIIVKFFPPLEARDARDRREKRDKPASILSLQRSAFSALISQHY
jgi:TonB family protein